MSKVRVEWVDYAKGICIVLVVMMHSTLHYGQAVSNDGWLHYVVAFAAPFRMPDFFMLAGIFLAQSINNSWRDYLDRKIIHFAYFYMLWLAIQLTLTETGLLLSDPVAFLSIYGAALFVPINTLWFVHMLLIFYGVTRLLRHRSQWLVFIVAAGLQILYQQGIADTQWHIVNRFFEYYVFFFAGYAAAPWIFRLAHEAARKLPIALAGLLLWAVINGMVVATGYGHSPGIGLVLGFLGAGAIVVAGSLLAGRGWATIVQYAGANSIVIYLSFFLPMKVLIVLFSRTGIVSDTGLVSLLITIVAVLSPLIFYRIIKDTKLAFLYYRPALFRLHFPVARKAL